MPGCVIPQGFPPAALFAVLTLIGLILVLAWVRQQPSFCGKRYFLLAVGSTTYWLFTVVMEISVSSLHCKMFWSSAAWLGIALLPTAWFFFIYDYSFGMRQRIAAGRLLALAVPPILAAGLAVTSPIHGLFYGPDTRLVEGASLIATVVDHGPLFYGAALFLYVPVALSCAVMVYGAFRARNAYRTYFILLIFITAAPIGANLSYILLGVTIDYLDPTPFLFAVVLFLLTWLIFTNRLFEVTTLAKDMLFAQITNPILVLDQWGSISAGNARAVALLTGGASLTGRRICEWPVLAKAVSGASVTDKVSGGEIVQIEDRLFDVQIMPIHQPMGGRASISGMILFLTEVTEAHMRRVHLETMLQINEGRLAEIDALRERLEHLVNLDPLTGLYNRRAIDPFFRTFTNEVNDGQPQDIVVAIIDLDHFKVLNDKYGHAAGDQILRGFSKMILRAVDGAQPVFRIGGEEFLIMFPASTSVAVAAKLQRLRQKLLAQRFYELSEEITFSAGTAVYPRDGKEFEDIYARADERLYAAKALGRNTTVTGEAGVPALERRRRDRRR